jgi:GntR family transcriptional regulator/MocR family aminotransferase
MRVPIAFDRASKVPIQRQIYDGWRRGILSGRFRRGDRVPSTRELATALSVSRAMVTAAFEQLIAEGYFESVHGSGTFISGELPDQPVAHRTRRTAATPSRLPVRLSRYASRLEANALRPSASASAVNLSKFGPDLDAFPFGLWRRLLTRHLRDVTPALFTHSEHGAGYAPLRQEIAAYVARSRAVTCDAGQVVIVNGSQQALDLCMRVLVDPGDEVALEDPGYAGTRHLAAAHGARIVAVGVTRDGLRIADLPGAARLVYVTPSHQFPTGVSMSVTRRLELIDWARPRGTVIVEDDYDSEYRYSGPPLPALQGLSDAVSVVYIGTFSNVMFPGLRIGYVILPPALVEPFTRAKWLADRYTTLLEQAALADFIREGHLERHIRRTRRLYKRRREALIESLDRQFGTDATVRGDSAGMHTLVRFAAKDIRARADRNDVRILSADSHYMSRESPNEFVIGFAATAERTLAEGVKRLAGRSRR